MLWILVAMQNQQHAMDGTELSIICMRFKMPNVNFSYGTHTADHSVPESARYTANTCAKTAETIKMPLNEVQMPT